MAQSLSLHNEEVHLQQVKTQPVSVFCFLKDIVK